MAANRKKSTATSNRRLQQTSRSKTRSRNSRSSYDFRRWFRSSAVVIFIVLFAALGVHFLHQSKADNNWEQKSDEPGNFCMEDSGDSYTAGAHIRTAPCDGRDAEHFYVDGRPDLGNNVVLLKLNPDWCVHPEGGSTALDAPITLERCDDSNTSQQWRYVQMDGNFYEFRNVDASRVHENAPGSDGHAVCLTIPSGTTGAQLQDRVCQSYIDQFWKQKSYDPPTETLADCPGSEVTASSTEAHCLGKVELERVYGWTRGSSTLNNQFGCLDNIYIRESGWRRDAYNSGSGATGIPQALPYSKMPREAWLYFQGGNESAAAQIRWGVGYIKSVYGTPCSAWAFWQNHGWYGPNQPVGSSPGTVDGVMGVPMYPTGMN